LLNGSPTEEFKPTRGLRQGDPLPPFLFIVVAKGLAELVRQTLKAKVLSGVKVGTNEVELCMLQFADDTTSAEMLIKCGYFTFTNVAIEPYLISTHS